MKKIAVTVVDAHRRENAELLAQARVAADDLKQQLTAALDLVKRYEDIDDELGTALGKLAELDVPAPDKKPVP